MTEPRESHSPLKRRPLLPFGWRVCVAIGLACGYLVSRVDEAASYIVFFCVTLIGIMVALIRYMQHGRQRFVIRTLPLLIFLISLGAIAAVVRVDDLTGNLVPTRVAFRWQPRRDELLEVPRPSRVRRIDLATTTPFDFPEFLGAGRSAFVTSSIAANWSTSKPVRVWKKEQFGAGWSGFVAVNGYAVTLEQRGPDELVNCYEIKSGDLMWSTGSKSRHATVPGGVGPRSTPTIYRGHVFALGATGKLWCLEGATGSVVWKKDLLAEIGITPAQDLLGVAWGRAASPLLDQGRVIVPLGGPSGPSLVAYDAENGDELWRKGRHQVSYSSPMMATLDGVRQIVIVCQDYVCGHDANTGDQLWEFNWPGLSNSNASCSQPVVAGPDRLFLSKGYALGATLLAVQRVQGRWTTNELWHRRTVMKTKFTNVVLYQGHVFGLDDSRLSCIDVESGRRKWTKRGRYGHGQVLRVGDKLLIQAESGEVVLVALDTHAFHELASFAAIDGKTWNNPCVFGEYLLVRNAEQAACYRLQLD